MKKRKHSSSTECHECGCDSFSHCPACDNTGLCDICFLCWMCDFRKCLVPWCIHPQRGRGLCINHHKVIAALVRERIYTWAKLVRKGRALPIRVHKVDTNWTRGRKPILRQWLDGDI